MRLQQISSVAEPSRLGVGDVEDTMALVFTLSSFLLFLTAVYVWDDWKTLYHSRLRWFAPPKEPLDVILVLLITYALI